MGAVESFCSSSNMCSTCSGEQQRVLSPSQSIDCLAPEENYENKTASAKSLGRGLPNPRIQIKSPQFKDFLLREKSMFKVAVSTDKNEIKPKRMTVDEFECIEDTDEERFTAESQDSPLPPVEKSNSVSSLTPDRKARSRPEESAEKVKKAMSQVEFVSTKPQKSKSRNPDKKLFIEGSEEPTQKRKESDVKTKIMKFIEEKEESKASKDFLQSSELSSKQEDSSRAASKNSTPHFPKKAPFDPKEKETI